MFIDYAYFISLKLWLSVHLLICFKFKFFWLFLYSFYMPILHQLCSQHRIACHSVDYLFPCFLCQLGTFELYDIPLDEPWLDFLTAIYWESPFLCLYLEAFLLWSSLRVSQVSCTSKRSFIDQEVIFPLWRERKSCRFFFYTQTSIFSPAPFVGSGFFSNVCFHWLCQNISWFSCMGLYFSSPFRFINLYTCFGAMPSFIVIAL